MSALRQQLTELLSQIPIDLGGGSSLRKGYMMAWLIRRLRCTATLDIGVYRGRSLFPQALAHKLFTGGVVYGVDPWSAAEFAQRDLPDGLSELVDRFLQGLDLEGIYQDCLALRKRLGYEQHCQLVRETSSRAARLFLDQNIRFGLIHIDGNHDHDKVLTDVESYLPLVKPGGIIVLDDISWPSVERASRLLEGRALPVYQLVSSDRADDYAVYLNGVSRLEALDLREALARVALMAE